ncbi:MAG: hypothetical protein PHP97_02800 [Candidatus Shapirobacteria bacterium]|nr:hypothetical protein [Candidatus Shapirobacteria bacterium]MDD3002360.1 hypothetical protein [Candidatus Shapirobacteria bacterium]MDD4383332.1 hypothetical protein [Candidatus Shapirobacteria bacterium]
MNKENDKNSESNQSSSIFEKLDNQRKELGFFTIGELLELSDRKNIILDPMSTLISKDANIGSENIFYPNTIIEKQGGGTIEIGSKNIFYPQTFIVASLGKIKIGNGNQFGDGGLSIKANYPNTDISIGNNCRLLNGVQILGITHLGSGSQIIGGQLTVQDCFLEDGKDFTFPDTDERGGVIKGFGLIRNIKIEKGKVINGQGSFDQSMVQDQSFYHPKK